MASFTAADGGQQWRSTGTTDRAQALKIAQRLEAEARARRTKLGLGPRKALVRARQAPTGTAPGPLTQREVAQILNLSERAVRQIERRAIQKLLAHPVLRRTWQQYVAGELDETSLHLTPSEIQALFGLAHTSEERRVLRKVIRLTQRPN